MGKGAASFGRPFGPELKAEGLRTWSRKSTISSRKNFRIFILSAPISMKS